ncbi:hypothetical protein JOF29_007190 [Kribbella aluminosa]|uniref:Uncharacterized protein n=1 Tax=Kribbella aluminosa TaxID=416017 RepID=A0ABS4UWR9_9ACTN|nr:hypothetical protein [Kribbella aluminosa]MBP2356080.1 hypothetical protein [Kribbella aluminosa]
MTTHRFVFCVDSRTIWKSLASFAPDRSERLCDATRVVVHRR